MNSFSRAPRTGKQKSVVATVVVVALLGLYLLLHPFLERKLGIALPNPFGKPQAEAPQKPDGGGKGQDTAGAANKQTSPQRSASDKGGSSNDKGGSSTRSKSPSKTTSTPNKQSVAKFALRDVGNKVLVSPAGLRYGPGSREGHRTLHVLKHAKDAPDRPIHGVFEGDRDTIFATIDEAYLLSKRRDRAVKVEDSGSRKVYTVNLRRRIGFIGGRAGKRDNHPAAKGLRLVLEDKDVITAFPIKP